MDKRKFLFVLVIGIVLIISAISAFILLGGKEEATQPVGENEGVVVDIDKKDRNEDEIKEDFEETVDKEREKRPVGMVDLPNEIEDDILDSNNEPSEGDIEVSNVREEVVGDKTYTKADTGNGNTIVIGKRNDEKNPNIKVDDNGVVYDFSNVGKLPVVEGNGNSSKLGEYTNKLAKPVESLYKDAGFKIISKDGENLFMVTNDKYNQSFIDEDLKYYKIDKVNDGKNYELAVKAAIQLGANADEKELLKLVKEVQNTDKSNLPLKTGNVAVDMDSRIVIKWE